MFHHFPFAPAFRDGLSASPQMTIDEDEHREVFIREEGNPVEEELVGAINSLHADQLAELVALTWLGRGDITREAATTEKYPQLSVN